MEFPLQTQHHPPARTASAASQTLKSRRRPSPPTSVNTADARPAKRTPNHVRPQAASPQVISSLIDQLSAISIPAHNHFENLLVGYDSGLSTPASPSIHTQSARNSFAAHDGTAVDPTVYYNAIREQNELYPDDACEPPVIRTSKPPSGLSPLTAPKKRDKPHSLSSYIGRSGDSSASLHSAHSSPSVSSFGNISVEAVAPRQAPSGSNRSSAESKRSAKGHRSLMYMSSRERLRQRETERKRMTIHSLEDLSWADTARKAASLLFSHEDTIKEEPYIKDDRSPGGESSRFAPRYSTGSSSPRRIRLNLVDGPHGDSPSEKGLIPERGSSLKHSGSPPPKAKRCHTDESGRQTPRETDVVLEEDKNMDQEAVMKERILRELEQEESEVADRIRELKKQKMRRDILAGKMPMDDVDAGASPPSVSRVSSDITPEPSPISTMSNEPEVRVQDSTKAHKVLGISIEAAPAANPMEELLESYKVELTPIPQTRSVRHSRHRSLTMNDSDDLASLPINYALALQRLEGTAPLSPSGVSIASTKQTKSSTDTTSPKRASSTAVGGRSAVGRKAATSVVSKGNTGNISGHKRSSSVTDRTISRMSPVLSSASEENATRHQSMHESSPPASKNLQLQRRRTLTRNPWSQTDVPARAEKANEDTVERSEAKVAAAAMQRPTRPIVEERPASRDSIDIDVESYLNSPRLSQKIRHPQTGRIISFSEVGDPQGYAVFVCVGMGLTRYVMAFYDQLATTLKLRLITPDRPGIGGSQADPNGTPLSWPDDVLVICQALRIDKFSILAHSAGAVYALATSLRMPQHIRGRVHLLAPWIPPSQMAPIGITKDSPPTQQLPRSQRFLRALPPSLLKVANSTFLSATSASLQRSGPKNSPRTRRKSMAPQAVQPQQPRPSFKDDARHSMMLMDQVLPNASSLTLTRSADPNSEQTKRMQEALTIAERERQHALDERLTFAIWDRATANANPATDLIVCLETKQTIGFRYEDINRPVVIHHGNKDSRVPVDNVRWLGGLMRKCEVRILEGEQHGLMASAQVMGNVLTEMASDWENWTSIVNQKPLSTDYGTVSRRRAAEKLKSQLSFAA